MASEWSETMYRTIRTCLQFALLPSMDLIGVFICLVRRAGAFFCTDNFMKILFLEHWYRTDKMCITLLVCTTMCCRLWSFKTVVLTGEAIEGSGVVFGDRWRSFIHKILYKQSQEVHPLNLETVRKPNAKNV